MPHKSNLTVIYGEPISVEKDSSPSEVSALFSV